MKKLIKNLLELQTLQFTATKPASTEKQINELRAGIPPQILAHYDRLVARGKKGVSVIRNQVCTACHVQVPRNTVLILMNGTDIQICENCGRYLSPPETTIAPEPPAKTKKRQTKPKIPLQTA